MIHLPINVSVKDFVEIEKPSLHLTKGEENRLLLFEEKIRTKNSRTDTKWLKKIGNMSRTQHGFSLIWQNYSGILLYYYYFKSRKKHLDTVHQKEKLIFEADRLRRLGYSVSAIAKKLNKNPRTINRYLKQEVTPISKAYGLKKRGILQPYHKEIDMLLKQEWCQVKLNNWFVKRDLKDLLHLFVTIFLRRRKNGKELQWKKNHFKKLLKTNDSEEFTNWLQRLEQSPYEDFLSFTVGIKKDLEAVTMAVLLDYNNCLAEGSINKIKVIKRIMYGRCSFNLLRNKILLLERFHSFN